MVIYFEHIDTKKETLFSLVFSTMVIVSALEKQLNMQQSSKLLSFECHIRLNLTSWIASLLWYVPSMMEVLNNISLHCP